MKEFDKRGVAFCRFVIGLCVLCCGLGVAFVVFAPGMNKLYGTGMVLLGGWIGAAFYFVLQSPIQLNGWKRKFVTPQLEEAIRRDCLAPGPKDSFSVLHAAKRFSVFCFVSCLLMGFFGLGYWMPSIAMGVGIALLFDTIVRNREERHSKKKN